jgi:hypothetical protein
MQAIPYLHVSMPHVEELTYFLVLLFPIFLLAGLGTVQCGLASGSAVYWSSSSSDASALQMMQLLGMIAVGVE